MAAHEGPPAQPDVDQVSTISSPSSYPLPSSTSEPSSSTTTMTSFISMCSPPGPPLLDNYDRHLRSSEQRPPSVSSTTIPSIFLDSMHIREHVFVDEQHIPLANELDTDDPRSWHFVAYASISAPRSGPRLSAHEIAELLARPDRMDGLLDADGRRRLRRQRARSDAVSKPVATLRIVPPAEYGVEEVEHGDGEGPNEKAVEGMSVEERRGHGCLRRGREPYVKLGRLSVLKTYRGMGLPRLLIDAAEEFLTHNPDKMFEPPPSTEIERKRIEARGQVKDAETESWAGLILVHAQTGVEHLWKKWGYTRDRTMGEWDEEGITHVGMWKRIRVVPEERPIQSSDRPRGFEPWREALVL